MVYGNKVALQVLFLKMHILLQVGLGETMTQDDVLNGIMRITVLVAITRPAEFIQITFQQQVQKS